MCVGGGTGDGGLCRRRGSGCGAGDDGGCIKGIVYVFSVVLYVRF